MDTVETAIRTQGLTKGPRITPQDIEATIQAEAYHVFPGTTLTVCCLTLKNGFTVVGEAACASPENFDAAMGQRIARDNAKQKIWALEGYALRNTLQDRRDSAPKIHVCGVTCFPEGPHCNGYCKNRADRPAFL